MPVETDFIRAVLARPDDDAPRLVYADWLLENGQDERAEFIHVQIKLARREENGCPHADDFGKQCWIERQDYLRRRERELLDDYSDVWFGHPAARHVIVNRWSRGFVESVTCTAADFLAHADAILTCQPIQEVTLTTWPREIPMGGMPGWARESWLLVVERRGTIPALCQRWPLVKTWHLPPADLVDVMTHHPVRWPEDEP